MESGHVEALRETLDGLRLEVAELRASRKRVVLAADDGRRRIERDLHEGVQQHLVALAREPAASRTRLTSSDPPAARSSSPRWSATCSRLWTRRRSSRSGSTRRCSSARRARVRAARSGGERRRRLRLDRCRSGRAGYRSRGRGRGLLVLCSTCSRTSTTSARVDGHVREEDGALVFEVVEERSLRSARQVAADGCATGSRRSAAS